MGPGNQRHGCSFIVSLPVESSPEVSQEVLSQAKNDLYVICRNAFSRNRFEGENSSVGKIIERASLVWSAYYLLSAFPSNIHYPEYWIQSEDRLIFSPITDISLDFHCFQT